MIMETRTGVAFSLPADREAHEPPEARGTPRDGVRLLVSRRETGEITHHTFTDLPGLLLPGDLIVINTSGTVPAAVHAGGVLAVHFSTPLPDGAWLVELRTINGQTTIPNGSGMAGQLIRLPSGAVLTLDERFTARLWRARLSTAVLPYLLRHGSPIRYSYVGRDWPIEAYQTVFATRPGSAEMPSASRPFTPEVVTRLVANGIVFAPLRLHTGVSSLEGDEDPYPEPYDVPPATARLVNLTRRSGGRIIAAGTTVVRALETAARAAGTEGADGGPGVVAAGAGWTDLIVTPEAGLRAVDGLLTGLHEPRSSHLLMLEAFAGAGLLSRCYEAAIEERYLWHEFGDVHLLLP
jgi:S-adenosylmethionine:tRNA ribosyltransferase-isomerase